MRIWYEPKLTLLSRPQFLEPEHMPVAWEGAATDGEKLSEFAGRLCYMSQHNPAKRSTREYIENILDSGHGSVFEHANYSVLCEGVSRSLTHELVRHRAGFGYSQLSQRFVDESEADFVVPPSIIGKPEEDVWRASVTLSLASYGMLVESLMEDPVLKAIEEKTLRRKRAREAARGVLPNSTETKIVVTGNIRAWRSTLELRGSIHADAEILRWAAKLAELFIAEAPNFFQDFEVVDGVVIAGYHKV